MAGEGIEPEVIIVRAPGVTTKLIVLSQDDTEHGTRGFAVRITCF